MEYILDSHAFLWYSFDAPQLPDTLRNTIESPENTIYISIVSIWEIGIKINAGKLKLNPALDILVDDALEKGFKIQMIRPEHIYRMMALPLHHRDPFDRMIIAQSIAEELPLASKDRYFENYGVNLVWDKT